MSEETQANEVYLVLCTCPDCDVASGLARELVAKRLAACCNLLPGVRSIYRYEGEVHEDPEVLLLAKTTAERYPTLEKFLRQLHPYELPEIVAVPFKAGLAGYLDWVGKETR